MASETDRGLFISALVAAGYEVIAVNPIATSRYRERLSTSGAKSDAGDARWCYLMSPGWMVTIIVGLLGTAIWPKQSKCWHVLIRI